MEARLTTMEVLEDGLVVQLYREAVKIDRAGFEENRRARLELVQGRPHAMLAIFPADIDFELEVTTNDHFGPEREQGTLVALAVVAKDMQAASLSRLFFTYYPRVFRTGVFTSEEEALTWLRANTSAST
jgi:hypothetical protein